MMKNPFEKYGKQFSENKFWQKMRRHARDIGIKVVYAALLLFYAYRRKETPVWARSIILGVLGYLLAPFDAIPDLSPIIGYTDDLGVLSFGLVTIASFINKDVKSQAREKLHVWFGEYDEDELKEVDEQL